MSEDEDWQDIPTAVKIEVTDVELGVEEFDYRFSVKSNVNIKEGDELVRRSDAEKALEEATACISHTELHAKYCDRCVESKLRQAREAERQRITEQIKDFIAKEREREFEGWQNRIDAIQELLNEVENE